MNKKFVAGFMTALMAAMTLVSPALGATALKDYPTFLGKVGDFYIVFGKDAAASDVAGAADIAANLAQLSNTPTAVGGGTTTTSAGTTDRKVGVSPSSSGGQIAGTGTSQFPGTLRNFHFSGLKESKFSFKGTDHSFHESVILPQTGSTLSLTHSLGSPINGTLKMRADSNAAELRFIFDDSITANDFVGTAANSTHYSDPLKVTVAGREFQIVAVPDATSFKALVGTVKTLSDGDSMTVGDLKLKVVQSFATSTAKIEVTDPSGNVLKSGINTGSTESVSYGGTTYNYKVLSSGATASGVLGYGQVVFGKGDVEKVFDNSVTATVSEFGSDWTISGSFAAAGRVQTNDYISVKYNPQSLTDATRYFTAGNSFKGPNSYFEINYAGYYTGSFAKVTLEPVTGQTVYSSTAATGYSTNTSLNGLKISSDVAGTLVSSATGSSTGYTEIYLLFNGSASTANFNNTNYWMAYKDTSTSRIVNFNNTRYPAFFNTSGATVTTYDLSRNTAGESNASIASSATGTPVENITLSYGGPGAQITYVLGFLFSGSTLLNTTISGVYNVTGATQVESISFAFQNRSQASTTTAPELVLGANSGTADASDVRARVESSLQNVETQIGDLITDEGIQVYSVKSNVESNKVVLGVPPETVYGLVKFGKTTASTTAAAGSTVNVVVPVTTSVAKLDSEVTTADKTGKDFVLVGGPCKNSMVADAKTAGKFAYSCTTWPASNFARIQVIDDYPSTGHQTVIVAGTRADGSDTRLGTQVLLTADGTTAFKLSGQTGQTVDVTGAALATATISAVNSTP